MYRWFALLLVVGALSGCPSSKPGSTCSFDNDCAEGQRCCDSTCRAILSDAENCGACGAVCPTINGTASCELGACRIACDPNKANCDNNIVNGCETDLLASKQNCGSCGTMCARPNSQGICSSGTCQLGVCDTGFANCDEQAFNGCETSTADDVDNCGQCNNACQLSNATAKCFGGTCQVQQCTAGFGDCDSDPSDGCEADLNADSAHCGACNDACEMGQKCVSGMCRAQAFIGFGGQPNPGQPPVPSFWRFEPETNKYVTLTALAPNGAAETRTGHMAVWDAPANRMIVYGGFSEAGDTLGGLWALNLGGAQPTWEKLAESATNPGPRGYLCYGHDPAERVVWMAGGIFFDGMNPPTIHSDLWKLELATGTWTQIQTDQAPVAPEPVLAACAIDPATKKFVVFGGLHLASQEELDSLWLYDLSASNGQWTQVPPTSPWPEARQYGVFFDGADPLTLFGGSDEDQFQFSHIFLNDLWTLKLSPQVAWESVQLAAGSPVPTPRAASASLASNGKLYVFGGYQDDPQKPPASEYDDLWMFDPMMKTWTQLIAAGSMDAPPGKVAATLTGPR